MVSVDVVIVCVLGPMVNGGISMSESVVSIGIVIVPRVLCCRVAVGDV